MLGQVLRVKGYYDVMIRHKHHSEDVYDLIDLWYFLLAFLRIKGYYDKMIHKHHSEDVYDLIDLRYFFISIFEH